MILPVNDKGAREGAPGGPLVWSELERAMRFELTTLTLARLCSTPELRPRRFDERGCIKTGGGPQEGKCSTAKNSRTNAQAGPPAIGGVVRLHDAGAASRAVTPV